MSISELLDKIYDNILKFNNTDILILFDDNNTLWMSYNDILKSIGYNDYKTQSKRLSLDNKYFDIYINIYPKSKLNKIQLKNQQPKLKMISESGLYILLSKSNKKIAKELSEKLFAEVLPELRKKR